MIVKQLFNIDLYPLVHGIEAESTIAVLELGVVVIWVVLLVEGKCLDNFVRFRQFEPNAETKDAPGNVRQEHPDDAHTIHLERKDDAEEEEPELDV